PALPTAHAPDQAATGRWGQVCRILAYNSNQAMHARDIAGHLGLTTNGRVLSGFNAQLCYWTRNGRLIRTAPSTYKIPFPEDLTTSTEP
ncbi:IS4 family transposase, partial [Streptomyces sp. NPDC002911]